MAFIMWARAKLAPSWTWPTSVYSALDLQPNIEYIDMPEGLAEKYQYFTEADMSNLRSAGYTKGFTSLEDGISAYVQDYLVKDDPYV